MAFNLSATQPGVVKTPEVVKVAPGEAPVSPEALETRPEALVAVKKPIEPVQPIAPPVVAPVAPAPVERKPDELDTKLTSIMEEDLTEVFKKLSDAQKIQFKNAGEETERQLKSLIQSTQLTFARAFELFKRWLSLVGNVVNYYFLEQLTKIKADKVMGLVGQVNG
ncbi:MAG: hypothetical protein V1821_02370 [bacterium]